MSGPSHGENTPDKAVEEDMKYCATCRPCCTFPHGAFSAATALVATIAWIFALLTLMSCHFMLAEFEYCVDPEPYFASCGDCHCINGDEPCPTGDLVPQTNFSSESVDQWLALSHTNPMNINCNPYENVTCDSTPPHEYAELFEDAVCAIQYNMTFVDDNSCPLEYRTLSYPSLQEAEADNAILTHHGSCGVCSSLQDLAVYVVNPDLTKTGQTCGIKGIADEEAGIKCFMDVGYTTPCATMWMYNVFKTREECGTICMQFTFQGDPSNGPPPNCSLAPCLECDELEAGPMFKKFAARTRRRSGLLSTIARPCQDILLVNHTDPCPAESGNTPVLADPQPTCTNENKDIGLLRYAVVTGRFFFEQKLLLSKEQETTQSYYDGCQAYKLENPIEGFWADVQNDWLGIPWRFSAFAGIIATSLGGVTTILTWTSTCAAFRQNFWVAMTCSYSICAALCFLTLVLLASDACPQDGCKMLAGSVYAILAGLLWTAATLLSRKTRRPAKPDRTVSCCCCPHWDIDIRPEIGPLLSEADLPSEESTTRITVTETIYTDGTKQIDKTTTLPDGSKIVERVISKCLASGQGESALSPSPAKTVDTVQGSDEVESSDTAQSLDEAETGL